MVIDSNRGRALIGRARVTREVYEVADKNVAQELAKPGEDRPKYLEVTAVRYFNGFKVKNEKTGEKELVSPGEDVVVPYEAGLRLIAGNAPKAVIGKDARAAAKRNAERRLKVAKERDSLRKAERAQRLKAAGISPS